MFFNFSTLTLRVLIYILGEISNKVKSFYENNGKKKEKISRDRYIFALNNIIGDYIVEESYYFIYAYKLLFYGTFIENYGYKQRKLFSCNA